MDIPRHVCVSCERFCYRRSVFEISELKIEMDIPIWRVLMAYVKNQNINAKYICRYCDDKFRDGLMPAYCVLNNLFVYEVLKIISSLNMYERILIQRAKSFQTIVKMGPVSNKNLLQKNMVRKVKGRTFHLPLPLQETWNKLCSDTDAINVYHELYILEVFQQNPKLFGKKR